MIEINNPDFSIEKISKSGQCFRMSKMGDNTYELIANHRVLQVSEEDGLVRLGCDEEAYNTIWKTYFALDEDYTDYIRSVDESDKYLVDALTYGRGIRILRQDPWEMIISFIISQQNNIKRISSCIEKISKKYGSKLINSFDKTLYDFPTPAELSLATIEELGELGLGYRSKYIVKTTSLISNSNFMDELIAADYNRAKEMLLTLYGIGIKVAECVCLFGLHHLEAFPVDTHIMQVLEKEYGNSFPFHKYLGYEGVIQQFIFYKDLHQKNDTSEL